MIFDAGSEPSPPNLPIEVEICDQSMDTTPISNVLVYVQLMSAFLIWLKILPNHLPLDLKFN